MQLRILCALLSVCLLWGGVAVGIKVGLWDAPVFGFVAARLWLGGLGLWLWARWRGASLNIPVACIPQLLGVGAFFTLMMVFVTWGTGMTAASRAAVFMNTQPIQVAVLAHFLLPGDRLSLPKMAGLTVAFLGVLVIFMAKLGFPEAASWWRGDLVVLLAAFCWALQTIYAKRLVVRISPVALTLWQVLLCALVTTLLSFIFEPWTAWQVTGRLVLAVLFLFTIPIFGVLAGWLLLQEPLGLHLLGGGILVAIGILLVTAPVITRRAVAAPADPPQLL